MSVKALQIKALEGGAMRLGLTHLRWDVSGSCRNTRVVSHFARNSEAWTPGDPACAWVDVLPRCRSCWHCLQVRGYQWEMRAQSELLLSNRSWFSTYTLTPENQYRLLCRASERKGFVPAGDETFRLRAAELGVEFTRYLKRVRKESGAQLRFLAVVEKHKSGLPHMHALFHEPDRDNVIRHKVLRGQWLLGYNKHKLVDRVEVAAYCAKYLAKSMHARVRASIDYGIGSPRRWSSDETSSA